MIGVAHQRLDSRRPHAGAGNPDADRDGDFLPVRCKCAIAGQAAQPLGKLHRRGLGRLRQHDGKFLAADAGDDIGVALSRAAQIGDAFEHAVAHRMAELVVYGLEVVDVDHHHAQRTHVALVAGQFGACERLEMTPVVDAGQEIHGGQRFQIAGTLLRLTALGDGERQPSPQQQAEHNAPGRDVQELRQDQQHRMAHHGCKLRRQNLVHAAKVDAEVDVLQDVSERVDGEHGEEQPRRAEGVRVADVEENDWSEGRQPQGNDDPIDQCGGQIHGGPTP